MKIGFGGTVVLFLLWCFVYFAIFVIGNIVGDITKNDEIMSWTILSGFILMIVVYLGRHYVELSFGRIGMHMVWPAVCMSVLMAAAYVLVLVSVYTMIDIEHLFPRQREHLDKSVQHLFPGIAGLLYGCIFCPILEEIGLRGILLGGLMNTRCRPWLAILITSLVFALLHGLGVHFVSSFIFALIVGWIYWRTGSIILCMVVHIVNNSLSFIDLSGQNNVVCLFILVGSLIVIALGLRWFAKKI